MGLMPDIKWKAEEKDENLEEEEAKPSGRGRK